MLIDSEAERSVVACQLHGMQTTLDPAEMASDVSRAASISCTILRQHRYLNADVVNNARWVAKAVAILCEMTLSDALHYLYECLELITEPLLYLEWCERRVREAKRKRRVVARFFEEMADDVTTAEMTVHLALMRYRLITSQQKEGVI